MRELPWLTALLIVTVASWALSASSKTNETSAPTSSEAATLHQHLVARRPDFVVAWPPGNHALLEAIPQELAAADAVPPLGSRRSPIHRLVVIVPKGFHPPPELRHLAATTRTPVGSFDLLGFELPQTNRVVFDLREDLAEAEVRLEGEGETVRCDVPRAGGGWTCPGRPEWNHVGPTVMQVTGAQWPAVWAHPVERRDLVMQVGPRPLGDEVTIAAALSDSAAATPGGAPVTIQFDVHNDGAPLATRTLRLPNRQGLSTETILLPQAAPNGTLTLRIRTPQDGRRHLGINLHATQRAGAPAPAGPAATP